MIILHHPCLVGFPRSEMESLASSISMSRLRLFVISNTITFTTWSDENEAAKFYHKSGAGAREHVASIVSSITGSAGRTHGTFVRPRTQTTHMTQICDNNPHNPDGLLFSTAHNGNAINFREISGILTFHVHFETGGGSRRSITHWDHRLW